jgi:hypothetical protein
MFGQLVLANADNNAKTCPPAGSSLSTDHCKLSTKMSALGFEPRTNGLKGRYPSRASSDQWPAYFVLLLWTLNKVNTMVA